VFSFGLVILYYITLTDPENLRYHENEDRVKNALEKIKSHKVFKDYFMQALEFMLRFDENERFDFK